MVLEIQYNSIKNTEYINKVKQIIKEYEKSIRHSR